MRSKLERRRRWAARVALYGSVVLVGGVAAVLVAWLNRPLDMRTEEGWAGVDYPSLPEVRQLQRYVRIDTSITTGDEVAGARFLAGELAAAGIASHIEVLGKRRANLWAILEGERREALVLHSHIDVDEVLPEEKWFSPPFEALIDLPWIYGRGVFDMKSVAIAQLRAFIGLKQSGRPLERSVILLATGGEETGSQLGVRWILAQHPELARRFWAVLTEGGVVEARSRGDIKYWGTETAQKRFVDLAICGGDRERLEAVRADLEERVHHTEGLRVTPEVREFLKSYVPTRDDPALRRLLADPDALIADLAAFAKLPAYLQSMFRDEAVPFPVAEAPGGGYQVPVKLHLLPGTELPAVYDRLIPPALTQGLATALLEAPSARHGSPTDHPVFRAVLAAIERRHPGTPAGPAFLPWTATDARFFRAAGIPSYGFSPFLIMNTDTLQVDDANERMALPGFVGGVELYAELLRALASDT